MTLFENLNLEAGIFAFNFFVFAVLLQDSYLLLYAKKSLFTAVLYSFNLILFIALPGTELAFRNSSGDFVAVAFSCSYR